MAEPLRRVERVRVPVAVRGGRFASLGAVGAAFLASLCCIGPVLFVTLGVGAGLASTFEPLRPVFTLATVALLVFGFYVVYGKRPAAGAAADATCASDESCAVPRSRTRDKALLWGGTVVAVVLLTFPQWSKLLV
ncbi:MAG: mercuric ion transporter MerT [Gemmatimonadaceae bacterium]